VGTKVMVDFPAFITRDSETKHILVGDESFALVPNGIIAETYSRLLESSGYDEVGKIMYESARKVAYEGQKHLIQAFNITLKTRQDFVAKLSELLFYISTFGYGIGEGEEQGEEFVFRIRHSFVAEYLKGMAWQKPVCLFLAGILAGGAQAYAELLEAPSSYSCVETKCIAIGDPYCEFHLAASKSAT
jgi:predicted hydrocarbon binding protein